MDGDVPERSDGHVGERRKGGVDNVEAFIGVSLSFEASAGAVEKAWTIAGETDTDNAREHL
jgi:hypothetical protein